MSANENLVHPLPVIVQNWQPQKSDIISKTTAKTYVIDPAGVGVGQQNVSICDYEPNRVRVVIKPIDNAVILTLDSPLGASDVATVANPPQGAYLPTATTFEGHCFYGPDAMWLKSITGGTITRVSVIKEYK